MILLYHKNYIIAILIYRILAKIMIHISYIFKKIVIFFVFVNFFFKK